MSDAVPDSDQATAHRRTTASEGIPGEKVKIALAPWLLFYRMRHIFCCPAESV